MIGEEKEEELAFEKDPIKFQRFELWRCSCTL
jgi:hypothetical protein